MPGSAASAASVYATPAACMADAETPASKASVAAGPTGPMVPADKAAFKAGLDLSSTGFSPNVNQLQLQLARMRLAKRR